MNKIIQFHSQNDFNSLIFNPYDESRFTTVHTLEHAQEPLIKSFKNTGYTILENHYEKNILKIE